MSILPYLLSGYRKLKLRNLLQPITGVEKMLPSDVDGTTTAVLECSVIPGVSGAPHNIYFTKTLSGSTQNTICVAQTYDIDGSWTINSTPIVGMGYGGAPSTREANCSFAFKYNGFYYIMATNGYGLGTPPNEDRNVYLYKSSDGITFSDLGKLLDKSLVSGAAGFGNTSIYPYLVNGKYEIVAEMSIGGIWAMYRFSSTSIESGWTLTSSLPGLQVVSGGACGGPHHFYDSGLWYIFYHYAPNSGTLPSYLAWATSRDLVSFTIKEAPLFGIESTPYGSNTDQLADPFIITIGNKTYLLAEYCDNVSTFKSQVWLWTYSGTFEQMVANT